MTLVEVLVVIAIIGLLVAMILPAVQSAREAARRVSCANNLRQVGLAVHAYHDSQSCLPAARITVGYLGWPVFLLPFMEQRPLFDQFDFGKSCGQQTAGAMRTAIASYVCPSRRLAGMQSVEFSGLSGQNGACGDYATVDGWSSSAFRFVDPSGKPRSEGMIVIAGGSPVNGSSGHLVAPPTVWRSVTNFAHVRDGLSQTLMIGEKHVRPAKMGNESEAGDGPYFGGWAYNTMRMAGFAFRLASGPPDTVSGNEMAVFGSAHPGQVSFVWGDGSVRGLEQAIDSETLARLGTRAGGTVSGDY
jgi:hypothetical protein